MLARTYTPEFFRGEVERLQALLLQCPTEPERAQLERELKTAKAYLADPQHNPRD